MLIIELQFLAGRFHATPWGRNVNEGAVEWPPSPFRMARALFDLCKRRKPNMSEERLKNVLEIFVSKAQFSLPNATTSHTRSFLNSNKKDPMAKQKIFDAFVALDKNAKLYIGFDVDVSSETIADLSCLLHEMNYLGRSESWVRAGLVNQSKGIEFNCKPAELTETSSQNAFDYERVQVACLRSETSYLNLQELPVQAKKIKGKKQALSWCEAIAMSSQDILKDGWSKPPAQIMTDYLRATDSLTLKSGKNMRVTSGQKFNTAKYTLHSAVLPRIIDTVKVAGIVRIKLMGSHKRINGGEDSDVSPVFSGKVDSHSDAPAKGHAHAFILPLDEDQDGRIDHIIVQAKEPFTKEELQAIDELTTIWQSKSRPDVKLILTSLTDEIPSLPSKKWISTTPFVTARHYRKSRGDYHSWIRQELIRELSNHGLPEPKRIELIHETQGLGHKIKWVDFLRNRKNQHPMRGHGFILHFENDLSKPFAIGALCHFGLGQFKPHRK